MFVQRDLDSLLAEAVDETHRECIWTAFAINRRIQAAKEWVAEWEPRPAPEGYS